MAGDALHRPLFKRGPEGNMRPQMISGGIFKDHKVICDQRIRLVALIGFGEGLNNSINTDLMLLESHSLKCLSMVKMFP